MKFRLIALCAMLGLGAMAQAKPFKWTSSSDIATWDIHSQNNALQNGIHANVYESLVYYNSKTFEVEPVLATAWREVSPTQVRFTLRQGVKFHDGSPLTVDDVVFTFNRVPNVPKSPAPKTSYIRGKTIAITGAARGVEMAASCFSFMWVPP